MALTCIFFFFFNDTATTEIYTLSLHDALPIWRILLEGSGRTARSEACMDPEMRFTRAGAAPDVDPALRSEEHTSELSHVRISYAVFCLKKKKKEKSSTRSVQGK